MKEEILKKEIELLELRLQEINYMIIWKRLGLDYNKTLEAEKKVTKELILLKKKVLNI